MQNVNLEQEVINLSKEKWDWMSERNIDTLDVLFHEKSAFVHIFSVHEYKPGLNMQSYRLLFY